MALSVKSQFPVSKRPNGLMLVTGGLMTVGGLGWCLRLACARDPKMAMVTYTAGTVGVCLMNISYYYRPVKKSFVPNWVMLLSGGILSGMGYAYCLRIAMEEHLKSTTLAYLVASLGYVISNATGYFTIVCGNKKPESRFPKIELSADEMFPILKCGNPSIRLIDGMYQCQNCKVYFGGKNAENKPEVTIAMERRGDFLRKMQQSLREITSKREKNRAAEKTCNGDLFGVGKVEPEGKKVKRYNLEDLEKCRDGTTQTESRFKMMGTQTQEGNLEKRQGKKPQLQVDAEGLHNGDEHPEKH